MGHTKMILDTEIVQILDNGSEYQVLVKINQEGPSPRDLGGLLGALQFAAEVCAGKFFPDRPSAREMHGLLCEIYHAEALDHRQIQALQLRAKSLINKNRDEK